MRKSETALLTSGDNALRWSAVLRALREAAGVSQEGWAARLGYGRRTIQHWEHGEFPPDAEATESLLRLCQELQLFREYRAGALGGLQVTADWLRTMVTEARLAHRSPQTPADTLTPTPPVVSSYRNLPLHLTPFIGREREIATSHFT
jgi:DNA-binding transcriptional regulator YiaG